MPIYKLNGEVYDIPEDVVADFEKDNPSATVTYYSGDDEYEIPVSERDAFLKDFPDARTGNLAAKTQGAGNTDKQDVGYTPSAEELAGFQRTIGQAQQTGRSSQLAARRIDARQKHAQKTNYGLTPPQVKLGQNSKVVETDPHFNLDTGKMESTYITEQGNEYDSRAGADIEQNAVDIANSLPGQLEAAREERDRLEDALRERITQLDSQYDSQPWYTRLLRDLSNASKSGIMPDAIADNPENRGYGNDEEYNSLMSAWRKNRELLLTLEDAQQKKTNEFWHSFGSNILNGYNFSLGGKTRLDDVRALIDAQQQIDGINLKRKKGEALTQREKAAEAVLKNAEWDRQVQEQYGDQYGAWAKAGKMGATSLDLMVDFMAMGGQPMSLAKGIFDGVVKGGERLLGTMATKGLGKYMLKATGATVGSMVMGAEITNTVQIPKVAGEVLQKMQGDVFQDKNGNYVFGHYEDGPDGEPVFVQGGESFLGSVLDVERQYIAENASEIAGQFLGGAGRFVGNVATKALEKIGLSKISNYLTSLAGKQWYKSYTNALKNLGWNGAVEEPLEEYTGDYFQLVMGDASGIVGDKNGRGGWLDADKHVDIWLGCATMSAMLASPRLVGAGVSTAQYYRYKHAADNASQYASAQFNDDEWQTIRDLIDGATNGQMKNVAMGILTDGNFTPTQKEATLKYIENIQKMRGYNLGRIAAERDETEDESVVTEVDHSFAEGYNTSEPDEMKMMVDEAEAAKENLQQYGNEFSVMIQNGADNPGNMLDYLMRNRDTYSDEQIAAAADYYQKQFKAMGVMEGAADNIDLEVGRANAEVTSNTHQQTGNVVMAKIGEEDYYVIGGDIVTDPETGGPSLAGTGGAVVVKNAATGEISVKSPQEVRIYSMLNADGLIQQNETELRQQLVQQADDNISFGSPASEVYDIEDQVSFQDGNGNVINGIVVQLPNAVDGNYVIQTDDNRVLQFTPDDLNRRIVAHNGMQVERASVQPAEEGAVLPPEQQGNNTGVQNAATEEQPQSAISRIPVATDEKGQPVMRKGRPQYQWHKASVDDAAAALIEKTGGDMVMARDTATDLVNASRQKLERIRKQKPKGEDPMEILESRMAIRQQESEQQEIISHWQKVNQAIQRMMQEESARRQAAIEAAKSEEQRQREAEEARRIREQQDEQERKRIREQIEKDRERRNKVYEPLAQARKEFAGDPEVMAVLNDTEPRSLEEWVSSLIRPHSMLWQDISDSETGLRTELGLKRDDMQRMMTLLGTRESGAKTFGKVVLEIHEGLPEGMKEMYTDTDVRNTLLDLFNEGSSTRMLHLTEEHRIEEARELARENERRNAEAEMDAWAEAYHLTPEERETFEDYLTLQAASEPEQEIINNIIADESYRRSSEMDQQPVSGTAASGAEGSQGQVQQAAEATGTGTDEETANQGTEVQAGQPPVVDNNVPGAAQSVDREALRELFRQIGASEVLADRISDFDVEQLTAMVDDWEVYNDDYGNIMEQQSKALQSKDKKVRDAAQAKIDEAQEKANGAFEPIEQYIESLNAKYGIESEEPFEGAIPTPEIDGPRAHAIREALIDAYKSGDPAAITQAVQAIQQYVDEGLDFEEIDPSAADIAENYEGDDPQILADEYIVRTLWNRYLDDDADPEYIRTGLKPNMRHDNKFVGEFKANEHGICINPNVISKKGKNNIGFEIRTAQSEKGWTGAFDVQGSTYGGGGGVSAAVYDTYFDTEEECQAYWAGRALKYLQSYKDKKMKPYELALQNIIKQSERLKPIDLRDAVRVESPEIGVAEANARARMVNEVKASIDALSRKYNSFVPIEVVDSENPSDELLESIIGRQLNENEKEEGREWLRNYKNPAVYSHVLNKIIIFADKVGERAEECFFHENLHRAIESIDNASEILDAYWNSSVSPTSEENKRSIEEQYQDEPENIKEEYFVSTFGVNMAKGKAGKLIERLSDEHRQIVDEILNRLGYDPRKEAEARGTQEGENRLEQTETVLGSQQTLEGGGLTESPQNQNIIGTTSSPEQIAEEEAKVDTDPSEGQKEAGNYQKGHIKIDGYDITIENPKGSTRSGVDGNGKKWEQEMHNTYGYIRGTEGVDGDHIDVFLSDDPTSGSVFVVDQVNPSTGEFDEHKVMYGFPDMASAEQAYLSNYEEGWKGLGTITPVSREEFKKWVESSHRKTKPFSEYKSVKPQNDKSKPAKEHKRIVSDEKMEDLRKQLLAKFNNMNAGIDVERMLLGAMYAVGKIERGVTKFADYAAQMVDEIGDAIRPYLKSFYNAVRDMPEAAPYRDQMDSAEYVEKFDVYNFDKKKQPTAFEKAEQVVKQQKAKKQVRKIVEEQPTLFDNMFADEQPQPAPRKTAGTQQKKRKPNDSDFTSLYTGKRFVTPDGTIEIARVDYDKLVVWDIDQDGNRKSGETRTIDTVDVADGLKTGIVTEVDKNPAAPSGNSELKLRPATEADLDSNDARWYHNGEPVRIMLVTRTGEQVNTMQFSKPKVSSVMLTNGKSVKLEDLMVEDKNAGEQPKRKTAWWSDSNRPASLDPSDYHTYTTDEAKAYFAQFKSEDGKTDFTKATHPNLAYITAAAWDGANIPKEELMQIAEIAEAERKVVEKKKLPPFDIPKLEHRELAARLLDAEHGSAVFENGKIKKVDGKEVFTGPVRQEKKAFVVVGRPAGGKSSVFANRLSHDNGARIVDSDVVKPWLSGYDDGYGAGYVQPVSASIANSALAKASDAGDNIVLPRIGGDSVMDEVIMLRKKGYDVQIYYNEVSEQTSIMRASSRFAQEGRYLSLDYLTKIKDKDSKSFRTFVGKKIGDYYEQTKVSRPSQRTVSSADILAGRGSKPESNRADLQRGDFGRGGSSDVPGMVPETGRSGRAGQERPAGTFEEELIFSYAEWKSNDVAFGEKPKEIWNSKSGKPMPTKEGKDNELHSIQRQSSSSRSQAEEGQGTGQESRGADSTGDRRSSLQHANQGLGSTIEPEYSVGNTSRVPDEGEETRDSSGGPAVRSGDNARVRTTTFHNNKRNNSGERGKDYAPTSPKARFNANVEAIKMMRELMDQDIEAPTKEQMEVLRKYSGWGGLGTFFNDETLAENKILHDLLSEEEYNDAVMSINSAYYTPATVIDTLWDVAKAMGFKGGNIVEGSAGIGNIIGQMPKDISRQSDIEAVEIDRISGNILKLLYPDAKVHIQGFQDTVIRNGSVDLAITNVPFVTGLHVIDKVDKDLSRRFVNIHDFCIAKNIRKLREGGIGIFITSSGTLDKSTDLRAWITDEGQSDVVGAFRLNNETFGGTKVTSDIIVVRKRIGGVKSPAAIDISHANPVKVGTYEDKFRNEHQATMVINDYFKEHPEMMAGEMAFGYEKGETFRPGSYGLYPSEGKNQEKMMAMFVKSMESAKENTMPAKEPAEVASNQLTAVKEGRMLIDDNGRICVSRYGEAVPLGLNDQKVKGQTKQQCFKDYQAVQAAVDDVLQQQLSDPNDEALKPKLTVLNKAYDLFVKRYGTLHKNTSISFLRNDIDFPSFQALEIYKEEKDINGKVTVRTSKPKLFSERVIGFKTEPQPKTVKDAVIASIFRTNGIDLEWIATKLNEVSAPPHGDKWTTEDVRKGILVSRLGFEDPSTGQLEIRYKYLSGNVREKLAIAEQYNAEGETAGRYAANVEELKKVVPMDIPSHLIDFSLGSSWIPVELYKDFVKETLDLPNVSITHLEGSWAFNEGYSYRNEKNRAAGVYSAKFRETIYGHQLVAAALNNRPVKISKQVSSGYGSSKTTHTEVDQTATQACAVRVDEIKDEFKTWAKKRMQEDPELSRRIEKLYNDKFNALVPMEVGDEFLPEIFEGANQTIPLYNHQKRGAMRGITSPTMLAHEVGTGKSFTLITTAMEMRRLGTAKKPMIVVQNATVAQITSDAKLLYPNAKVLSLSEQDRDAEGRRAFYAKIKYNDWDIIIVPQSTFERIPDSPERELQFIQEKIDEKKHVIEAAQAAGVDNRDLEKLKRELEKIEQEYGDKYLDSDPSNSTNAPKRKKDAKREAASLDKAETRAKEQLDRAVDDVQYFDDLGVDALLVDEAHEYKHLGFQTSIGRGIKGIDPSYSKKCAGLYNKTRSVFEKAGWKNVVFATGTPISNTAAEIWTFMKYLMPADVMKANDIYYFDDFVHNFGNVSQMLEFSTSGKFKENTRFAAYVNKPELIRIWSQVADTVRSSDTEVKSKEPDVEGGKDQDVFLPQSPSLIRIMAAVRAELERFENMTGQQKKENSSIPLTMYGVAKRAAIDPRLVDAEAPDEPLSKTNAAVKEIVKDLKATESYKGTVAVFCDNQNRLGVNAAGKKVVDFNIYDDMKAKLIKAGVPEKQIAIIKSGMSITAKQKIFDAVNSGDIRVVLGSTQTLGTGVNMQERLHLLIHMDAPDRPMDYTQRNGRIKRQGNLHKEWGKTIRIVRFGVEDSLDVTAYQRLKTKSGFIDSIMNGKAALANNQIDRTVEEEEEGLFDNPVAVLSGSQYALKKNQAERELRKYQGKKAQWEADQIYVTNQLRYNANQLKAYEANISEEKKTLDRIKGMFPDGTVKTITVEGVKIDMTKDDGAKKLGDAIKEKINEPVNAIVKRNRENAIYNDETLEYTISLDGHDVKFTVQVMRESVWDDGRMKTVIHKYTSYTMPDLNIDTMPSSRSVRDYLEELFDQVVTGRDSQDRIDAMQQGIARINAETEQIQKRVGIPFQFNKELEEARQHVEEYTKLMKKEMEEKEAKYAAQQKEAEKDGGFNLNKAEDSEEDDDIRYSAAEDWDEPTFYSNAEMAVESIRQEKATPEQWLAMIQKNGGLKAGEDKWLGLSEQLNDAARLGVKSISKDAILNYIHDHQIEIEDVYYDQKIHEPGYHVRTINQTRENYTTNNLENKREIALVVPTIEAYNQDDKIHFGDAGEGRAVAWIRFGETTQQVPDDGGLKQAEFKKIAADNEKWYREHPDYAKYGIGDETIKQEGEKRKKLQREALSAAQSVPTHPVRVLVIDEIQSKRHQDGRERGYRKNHPYIRLDAARKEYNDFAERIKKEYGQGIMGNYENWPEVPENIRAEIRQAKSKLRSAEEEVSKIPDAPFEKNWHELAMKRMLRYAAENGYDKIAWTTGEQQAQRYNIGRVLKSVKVSKWGTDVNGYNIDSDNAENEKGVYLVIPYKENVALEVNRDGLITYDGGEGFKGHNLADIVGKELALRILDTGEKTTLDAGNLRVGGEGMKVFYDEILPLFMNKYGKKWGVRTADIQLKGLSESYWENMEGGLIMHSVNVTPDMKESVMKGQPMFRDADVFTEGESFPIHTTYGYSSFNVLDRTATYSTDLMPDVYASKQEMLDAIRRQYPAYYARIEDGQVVMESWQHVLGAADDAQQRKDEGSRNYVERKTRNAVNAVNSLAKQMHLDGDLKLLTTTEGLTGKRARARGWFDKNTGKITLVLPNNTNQSDLINTLLHEGVAHYGLRKMFGQHFDTFLDNVYNNVSPEIKRRIDAAMKRNGWNRHEATEEYLARLAEHTDFDNASEQGWWQKIKDFFINMLANVGLVMRDPLTDNELRYILWRSHDRLLHPDDRRSIFDKAREIQMQSRLRVGPYSERQRQQPTNRKASSSVTSEKTVSLYGEADMLIEDVRNSNVRTIEQSLSVGDRVRELPKNQLIYAYNKVNGMMLDENGLNIDEHNEKVKADWIKEHGIKGVGWAMSDDLKSLMKKYGEGMIALRWELLDRMDKLDMYSTDYDSEEINAIVDKAKADGSYLLAPNGKPSNLNELQWAQVRTAAFKNWFGDWENDPQNASKVVDENGEPKVMYHKTNLNVVNKGVPFYTFYEDSHFGTLGQANDRVRSDGENVKTYEVFLNIRNPQRRQDADQDYLDDKDMTQSEYWQLMTDRSKGQGHDGIVYLNEYEDKENPADSWIAFKPNQIKSATENSGDFSTEDDDIRYSIRTKEEADDMGLLYRDDETWIDDVAKEAYEKAVAQDGVKVQEAGQDSMIALKLIQNAIAKETGNVATGAEDAYNFENRMHGRAKNMTEQYDWNFYRPMLKSFHDFCKEHGYTQEQGLDYLISKSGLERNMYYAMRSAVKEKLAEDAEKQRKQLEKDYAKGRIPEQHYKDRKAEIEDLEKNGVDDAIKDIKDKFLWKKASKDYADGLIDYGEMLRRREMVIMSVAPGYEKYAHDYSGLTETFAKDMFDSAQRIRKEANRAIDPQERRALWHHYDEAMKQAYSVARDEALDAVFSAEQGDYRPMSSKLWSAINAATEETLKQNYESGLMDRNTYNKVRSMFEYYIPLRGWDEDKASDAYTYMGKDNVFSPAVKKTWGRTSKAENPLAYIGNIAVSTIIAGHRNLMKQHFLNYVMNNPTSLVSISESWYENIGNEDDRPVWILRTADTVGKSGDELAQIINDFNEEMRQKQRDGKAMPVTGKLRLDVHATSGEKSEHVVEVQRAGHTYQLYINGNPKAAQALNGSAARAVSRISDTWLGQKLKKVSRNMAMYFTSKNPAFVLSNLSRDLNMAGASVAINEDAAYNARFIANVVKVLAPRMGESSKWMPASKQPTGLMPSLMRKWMNGTLNESNETERLFKEFMTEGGETGFVNMLSIESFKERMQKEMREMNGSSLTGSKQTKETSIHKGLRLLGDTFEFYNRCAEDATRFIVYMTSRQRGKTLEESIADAKNVTLNFNRKGTGAMGNADVRDLFIFVNPAIQAFANMYRMAKGHPLKLGAVAAAFVAGGALMPIINNWLLNMFGDDDDKNSYWNLPPWVRKNNLVFWVPGTKNFVTIPLAQEFRVFYGIGEMASSLAMDHPVDKWGLELFSSVADLVPINPTGNGGNLLVNFSPTAVQPIVQIAENVDFTGKPIWRENQGNKHAPMYDKAYVTTPKWMVKLSEGINSATGGNRGKKGFVESTLPGGNYINNPAVWNHLLQGYLGGMYNTVAKTVDVAVTAASGELPKIYQTPVVNRFLNRPVERDNAGALGDDYYNLVNERDILQYELKTWGKAAADTSLSEEERKDAQEHIEEIMSSDGYRRAEAITHYEKIMKDLKAGERAATDKDEKQRIKQSIPLYKQQLMDELAAVGSGKESLDAAVEAFEKAKTLKEKNVIRNRINRIVKQKEGAARSGKTSDDDVKKALSYLVDSDETPKNAADKYVLLATADDLVNDARISAAKTRIKQVTDEYKKMLDDGRTDEAATYREEHAKWFAAEKIINSQQRGTATNKKLLGKGYDSSIMKLIAAQRQRMLDAIEGLE